MDLESIRDYCLAKTGVSESLPFDENTLVFKVLDKMFLLISLEGATFFNVKCDPELAIELREEWEEIFPAYHMNKKHWNSVRFDGRLTDKKLMHFINHSYDLVVSKMTKKNKLLLQSLKDEI